MQALLDNAANESSQLGLTLGQDLSSAQQAAVTSDIVWCQNEVVDGKSVVVPRLYLAPGHEAVADTTISGRSVSLTAGSITNRGTISDSQSSSTEQGTTIAAGGSLNVVSGGDMSVKGVVGSAGDATFCACWGQTIKDTYRSTESTQSGVYAGSGGLGVWMLMFLATRRCVLERYPVMRIKA